MAGVAAVATVISTATAVGGAVMQNRATREQNRADRRARQIERRQAALENARQRRLAIAQRRIQMAEQEQSAENQGIMSSSALSGARGALLSDTASNIGFANTQIASNTLRADTIGRGYSRAASLNTFANGLNSIGQAAQSVGTFAARFPDARRNPWGRPQTPEYNPPWAS